MKDGLISRPYHSSGYAEMAPMANPPPRTSERKMSRRPGRAVVDLRWTFNPLN